MSSHTPRLYFFWGGGGLSAFSNQLASASAPDFTAFWLCSSLVDLTCLPFFLPTICTMKPTLQTWTRTRHFVLGLTMAEIHQAKATLKASHFKNDLWPSPPAATPSGIVHRIAWLTHIWLSVDIGSSLNQYLQAFHTLFGCTEYGSHSILVNKLHS